MWSTEISIKLEDKRTHLQIYSDYLQEFFNTNLDIFEYEIREWKTTPKDGYWLPPHNHTHSNFTVITYGEVTGWGGELIIQDPRTNANRGWPSELGKQFAPLVITPKKWMSIIFPSFCVHTAAPFRGKIREAYVSEIELFSLDDNSSKEANEKYSQMGVSPV
jgi:hypothetical protein